MVEYIYSPHYDFYIPKAKRSDGFEMGYFHFHNKYEIYYAVEGSLKFFIDNSVYIVNAGSVVLIGSESMHKTTSVESMPFTRYVLNFSSDFLNGVMDAFQDADFMGCFGHGVHVIPLSLRNQQIAEMSLSLLWGSQDSDSAKSVVARKLQLAQLLLQLDDWAFEAKKKNDGKMVNAIVEGAQSYISCHYTEKLTLPEIAKQVYVNEHYLSRLFKKSTGSGVVEYINNIRLSEARRMLEKTSMQVSSVGELVGFGTTTHFSRLFKESTGLSPQSYRKLYYSGIKR